MNREVARFVAAVRNGMSEKAVSMTAFDLADQLTDEGGDPEALRLLRRVLESGAASVRDEATPPAGTLTNRKRADVICAGHLDQAGNIVSGLSLEAIGLDGHTVANTIWKISAYLKRRGQAEDERLHVRGRVLGGRLPSPGLGTAAWVHRDEGVPRGGRPTRPAGIERLHRRRRIRRGTASRRARIRAACDDPRRRLARA